LKAGTPSNDPSSRISLTDHVKRHDEEAEDSFADDLRAQMHVVRSFIGALDGYNAKVWRVNGGHW
jgi:hypothetical protein